MAMLNIVLPIAGRGSRFLDAGYRTPKPLIPIHGVPMIEVVVNNVRPQWAHRFIFLALKEHLDGHGMRETLERIAPGCQIIQVDTVTEGAACTVLLARDAINNDDPLMLANSDQWVDVNIDRYLGVMDDRNADGLIMTMQADDPKWSFVQFDSAGMVVRVVEKQAISDEATVGIYNFRHGRDFVWSAEQMIAKNLRVNNEFYVAPVYEQLVERGSRVVVMNVGRIGAGMYGLGLPADLEGFLTLDISRRAAAPRAVSGARSTRGT